MTTDRNSSEWIAKAAQALARLAEQPWTLFLVLVAVNTLARPYVGITHDARLYSAQVLNRVEDGAYADDLFFRYGSQDQYSLFSRLAAPLVRAFGLPAAFFLIFLVSKSLLLFGMMRLVHTLVPNRVASTLTLIYCMAITIPYGGQKMLHLQENFVTPRMLACALVLIGLDLTLRGRPIFSGLLIAFAAALHPLMAFGGILIWAGYHLWKYLGVKAFVGATAGAGVLAAVVLGVESLGQRCFGPMDDVWRQAILVASSFNFPSQWAQKDWWCLAFQLAILGIAIGKYRSLDADKARFLIVLLLVTLAGTVGAVLAEDLPYALLLQGQPYRALWILAFLHLAFVFWFCIEWSSQASMSSQLAGCVLLAYLCCTDGLSDECWLPVFVFPLAAVVLRGLEKTPRDAAWLVRSIRFSLVLGGLGWAGYKLVLLIRGSEDLLRKYPEYLDVLNLLLLNVGPIVFLAGACWLLVRMPRRSPLGLAALAAGCLGVQTFLFAFPQTDFYAQHCTQYRADLRGVHDLVHRHRTPAQPLPTVYCDLACLDYVWLDLHAQSYFDWWQAGNFMFRREMAMEGRRRARLVGPFEIAHYRQNEKLLAPGFKDAIGRIFQTDFKRGPLSQDDLARLCQEPGLDYVVLAEQVEGVNAVQVGRLYVYSCPEVRTALRLSKPSGGVRVASK